MQLDKKQFQSRLLSWFQKNKRDLPWRKNKNPYRVWISEIMLQQTQVKTVIPYYERWLKTFPTLKSLAKAPIEKVLKLWEGLGYYSRARNLKRGAEIIVRELKSRFPETRETLLQVPGIGPYTAGAIASIAFGKPEPLVDGNVGRVFARLFEIPGIWNEPKTNQKLWKKAREVLSVKYPGDFNEALMELGATVCTKDNPRCGACPVSEYCRAYRNGTIDRFPHTKKSNITKVEKVTLLLRKNGSVLLRRKKPGHIMAGLYEFPTFEKQGRKISQILQDEKLMVKSPIKIGNISHGYTRFKASLDVWQGEWQKGVLIDSLFEKPIWVKTRELDAVAMPSVFRKIAEQMVV